MVTVNVKCTRVFKNKNYFHKKNLLTIKASCFLLNVNSFATFSRQTVFSISITLSTFAFESFFFISEHEILSIPLQETWTKGNKVHVKNPRQTQQRKGTKLV